MTSFVLWTSIVALCAWLWLMLFRGGFWRAACRIDENEDVLSPTASVAVAVVVPARNEADVIGEALESLTAQDYPGAVELIVVDDRSDDGTGRVAQDIAGVHVVSGTERPAGWTGKMWAVSQGLAVRRTGDYVWLTDVLARGNGRRCFDRLTDADIRHHPRELAALIGKAEEEGLDLVSLMVRLRLETFWDRLLIPAFVFFFQKLYPFLRQ